MISTQEALRLILKNTSPLPSIRRPLHKALGLVLAQNITSPSDYPLYDVSAMDGYGLKTREVQGASASQPVFLKVLGSQKAGDPPAPPLKAGECRRVMTGGVIPRGADAVLERERVAEKNGTAAVSGPLERGRNIRSRGEGIRQGASALKAGARLHSRAIGFLASLGVAEVRVHPAPRVALLVTGNELVTPGQKPRPGQIYDSNQWMLETALEESGVPPTLVLRVPDRPALLKKKVQKALSHCDVLLLVGGGSVGDSDFSKPVLESLGVRRIFWRVSQKPGFPLYFGRRGKTLVFGLPGNPASAWINYHEYVAPALRLLRGLPPEVPGQKARLASNGPERGAKTLFLKARWGREAAGPKVFLLKGQGSHLLRSLAEGDCLAVAPPGKGRLKRGETLEIHPLPEGGLP